MKKLLLKLVGICLWILSLGEKTFALKDEYQLMGDEYQLMGKVMIESEPTGWEKIVSFIKDWQIDKLSYIVWFGLASFIYVKTKNKPLKMVTAILLFTTFLVVAISLIFSGN